MRKNEDWVDAVSKILNSVSSFAHTVSYKLSSDTSNSIPDNAGLFEKTVKNKITWWKVILKYISGAVLMALTVFVSSLCFYFGFLPVTIWMAITLVMFVPSGLLILSAEKDRKLKYMIKEYAEVIGTRPEVSVKFLMDVLNKSNKIVKRDIKKLLNPKYSIVTNSKSAFNDDNNMGVNRVIKHTTNDVYYAGDGTIVVNVNSKDDTKDKHTK